ncbi:mevalonate kinase [Rhodococcus sp. IEGM 1330]|uniref:mevalonate kinase family protein n=1 Tax=Rhodococcus sp. IEGM 1330 TaxID=3082225 RepID=UPI002952ED87|nr:galactokinase family protein [Rhodococcus sp. IEGM 1330]MDV8023800.1 galactokinase family protein [Rhodococcus sp. IEGM 1330]
MEKAPNIRRRDIDAAHAPDCSCYRQTSAPLRICLMGEHLDWHGGNSVVAAIQHRAFVGLGRPGLKLPRVLGIDRLTRYLSNEKTLSLQPVAVRVHPGLDGLGLGSTSAVMVAAAFGMQSVASSVYIRQARAVDAAYRAEFEVFKGGGMDHIASGFAGIALTSGGFGALPVVDRHELKSFGQDGLSFIVIDTRIPKQSGSIMRQLRTEYKKEMQDYANSVSDLSDVVFDSIVAGNVDNIVQLFEAVQRQMVRLPPVCPPSLIEIIEELARHKIRGVKVCGSGGGGALIFPHIPGSTEHATILDKFFPKLSYFRTGLSDDPVRTDHEGAGVCSG